MTQPSLHQLDCPDPTGGHRIGYWQWGSAGGSHLVVCVHGLTRQGRDFDVLAGALCQRAAGKPGGLRVVCPDMPGRGQSSWLADPMGYQLPFYAADVLGLLGRLQAEADIATLDWVGTSMGGLIGMALCGQPGLALPAAVRRLVLNDIGPALQWQALQRIAGYLGQAGEFDTFEAAADALWAVSSSFGPHTPAQWRALSTHMVRPSIPGAAGPFRLHYDPAIAIAFRQATAESTGEAQEQLWSLYDNIRAQTLLLRGTDSDLLARETALAMGRRGPCARLVEFAGVGHAPTLVEPRQVAVVTDFLLG